ncbi:MAG: ImmA/IrrE family metallo-endopeptidase [Alphaproteobacteria bacterium]|nr:ImmA/IrrE family metallo-endopeptidase [Alphaproteobacteria bacterium]
MNAEDTQLAYLRRINAEANAFAMELLMPEQFLRDDLKRMGGVDIEDSKTIAKLAKRYQVSAGAMILRIGQLSEKIP